jgi:formamidopyrimidine-DNA glycosylase
VPELPEVHALAIDLGSRLNGRTIETLQLVSFAALKTFEPPVSALANGVVRGVSRHGKFLDIGVDADAATNGSSDRDIHRDIHLIIHLARAGRIRWRENAPTAGRGLGKGPLAARLVLNDHTGSGFDVTEAGTKKSLAIYVVGNPLDVPGIARLGPDPLSKAFTPEALRAILARAGRSQIKGVLRNQSIIAGIGNAYSDEILHVAKMSPYKPASMSPEETSRLFVAIQSTLNDAIARAEGLSASELKAEKKSNLRVHGRNGEPCPVCGDTVRQVRFADSTLEYCPTCQTGGKPLADRVLSRLLK